MLLEDACRAVTDHVKRQAPAGAGLSFQMERIPRGSHVCKRPRLTPNFESVLFNNAVICNDCIASGMLG